MWPEVIELANYVRFRSHLAKSPQTQLPCSTGPSILELTAERASESRNCLQGWPILSHAGVYIRNPAHRALTGYDTSISFGGSLGHARRVNLE